MVKWLQQGNHKGLPVPYTRRGLTIGMKFDGLIGTFLRGDVSERPMYPVHPNSAIEYDKSG
jgi:hypothetical protein